MMAEPGRFPVFIWELQGAAQPIYGFPAIDGPGGGVKSGVSVAPKGAWGQSRGQKPRDSDPLSFCGLL